MIMRQNGLRISTRGRGTYEITESVRQYVKQSGVTGGMCNIFCIIRRPR